MSGKEEFQQEIPLPPPYENWINASVIENQLTFDEQQELDQATEEFHALTSSSIAGQKINRLLDTMHQQINKFCNQQEK